MLIWGLYARVLAEEPVIVGPTVPGAAPSGPSEQVLPWSGLGLRPAAAESPAIGPEQLAAGPEGRLALYDPVARCVRIVGGATFAVPRADGLAFAAPDVLLVLDEAARLLRAYGTDGTPRGLVAWPGLVPPGGWLRVEADGLAVSVDAFGNGHPIAQVAADGALTAATGARLLPAPHRVVRRDDALLVDGAVVAKVAGRAGGRMLGEWLIVESIDASGATRTAVPLGGGTPVALPVRGRLYAPTNDLAVAPDGALAWMDPRPDGLHLHRVTP